GVTWAVGAADSSQDAGAASSMSIRSVAVSAVCPSVRSVFHLEACAAGQRMTSAHQPHAGDTAAGNMACSTISLCRSQDRENSPTVWATRFLDTATTWDLP